MFKKQPLYKCLTVVLVIVATGCTSLPPPQNQGDICSIFRQYPQWYDFALSSERKWKTPIATQFAFIKQESSFVSTARPPASSFGSSSAYGYPQAQNGTWQDYLRNTKNWGATRDDMYSALDFIGWYNSVSNRKLNIPFTNAQHLYLAYHEGWGGYKRRTYNKKAWLATVSKKVAKQTLIYNGQLRKCR